MLSEHLGGHAMRFQVSRRKGASKQDIVINPVTLCKVKDNPWQGISPSQCLLPYLQLYVTVLYSRRYMRMDVAKRMQQPINMAKSLIAALSHQNRWAVSALLSQGWVLWCVMLPRRANGACVSRPASLIKCMQTTLISLLCFRSFYKKFFS